MLLWLWLRALVVLRLIHSSHGFVASKKRQQGVDISRIGAKPPQDEHDYDYSEMEQFQDPNSRLSAYIRKHARYYHRPTLHAHDCIDIHVSAGLYQVVELDQRNNLATLSAYFDVWWFDKFLPWNATDFDGIKLTFVPAKWIWKPEFYLYHSIQGRTPEYAADATAEIRSDGRVRMFIPITSRALCPINVKYFPFDTQNCSFYCGSWSYQTEFVRLVVENTDVFLGDFYDNQEWLLMDANLSNGTLPYIGNESFSMVYMSLLLRRQSFYYVFNLVFPTTLVSLVAVIGFHAPINATGRRESKFRLGIMTLLSMSVMLLMLVDEMKFALESIPGQRGSFSDVPLLGIYYMTLILIISVATCTTSIFVHLEKYALRNQHFQAIPWCLRFFSAKRLFCCYVPPKFRYGRGEETKRSNNVNMHSRHSSYDSAMFRNLIPTDVNFTEVRQEPTGPSTEVTAVAVTNMLDSQKIDVLISLLREVIDIKQRMHKRNVLPVYWERFARPTLAMTTRQIVIVLFVVLFFAHETVLYTLTTRDRQWVDFLRHTTIIYHNREFHRRKLQEELYRQWLNDRHGPFQLGNFFGDNYTVDANANFIDKGRIYSTGE